MTRKTRSERHYQSYESNNTGYSSERNHRSDGNSRTERIYRSDRISRSDRNDIGHRSDRRYRHVRKDRTTIKMVILATAIVLIVLCVGGGIYFFVNRNKPVEVVQEEVPEEIVEEVKSKQPERDLWLANKSINDDYIGEIVFESGLVNKSFVQAKDTKDKNGNLYHFYTESGRLVSDPTGFIGNDVYIWTNWKDMTYDYNIEGGSVFMDYRNELNDQNIIIYGHHFSTGGGNDPERNKAFTPLENLLEQDNYDKNKFIDLILDNETRIYEIAYVYIFDVEDPSYLNNAEYWRPNYNCDDLGNEIDRNYYKNYINFLEQKKLYETNCKLTTDDKTLTLQTCIGGSTTRFEIIVCKLIDTKYFD